MQQLIDALKIESVKVEYFNLTILWKDYPQLLKHFGVHQEKYDFGEVDISLVPLKDVIEHTMEILDFSSKNKKEVQAILQFNNFMQKVEPFKEILSTTHVNITG